jgi:CheY-like chemotaxis protein
VGLVLIVDDDADIRTALAMVLSSRGYRSAEASQGQHAIEQLTEGGLRPSVILLDLMMPVMNGWDFMVAAAKDEALARIPVVVLTGYRAMAEKRPLPGVVALLAKPPDVEELMAIVQRYC